MTGRECGKANYNREGKISLTSSGRRWSFTVGLEMVRADLLRRIPLEYGVHPTSTFDTSYLSFGGICDTGSSMCCLLQVFMYVDTLYRGHHIRGSFTVSTVKQRAEYLTAGYPILLDSVADGVYTQQVRCSVREETRHPPISRSIFSFRTLGKGGIVPVSHVRPGSFSCPLRMLGAAALLPARCPDWPRRR